MNILTDQLPNAVEIDGQYYQVNTDFRTCLCVILAYEDPELTIYEKQAVMLQLIYNAIPENQTEAALLAVKFLNCGDDPQMDGNDDDGIGRLYSFDKDAKYIYSAIKQSHGVDLDSVDHLHWWKFCYLFLDLREDCFFHRLIHLRRQKKLGKLTKEEKELYMRIQSVVDLPEVYSPEEQSRINDFMKRLRG